MDDTFWPIYLPRHVHDVDGGRLHDLVGLFGFSLDFLTVVNFFLES